MTSPSFDTIDGPLLSPTKARQAALQAKDWAYVHSWLGRLYSPKPIPTFERNEDTLRTLLAMAAANDAADEEAHLVHRAREEVLHAYNGSGENHQAQRHKCELLDEVEQCLDEKTRRDLDDLANSAVVLGAIPSTSTISTIVGVEEVGHAILELTMEEFNTKEQLERVGTLQKYLTRELEKLRDELEDLRTNPRYETPTELPGMTAEWTRSAKILMAKVGEYQDKVAGMQQRNNNQSSSARVSIEQVVADEKDVLRLMESVTGLEERLKLFHGLPQDVPQARSEYRRLQGEVDRLVRQRDAMFDKLRR